MKRTFYVNHTDSEAGFISHTADLPSLPPTPGFSGQLRAVGSRPPQTLPPPQSTGLSAPALPGLCRRHTPHRQPARPFNPSSAPHGAQRPAWSCSEGNTRPAAAQRIVPSPAEPGPGCFIPPTIPPSASAAGLRVPGLLWSTGHPTPVPPSTAPTRRSRRLPAFPRLRRCRRPGPERPPHAQRSPRPAPPHTHTHPPPHTPPPPGIAAQRPGERGGETRAQPAPGRPRAHLKHHFFVKLRCHPSPPCHPLWALWETESAAPPPAAPPHPARTSRRLELQAPESTARDGFREL